MRPGRACSPARAIAARGLRRLRAWRDSQTVQCKTWSSTFSTDMILSLVHVQEYRLSEPAGSPLLTVTLPSSPLLGSGYTDTIFRHPWHESEKIQQRLTTQPFPS